MAYTEAPYKGDLTTIICSRCTVEFAVPSYLYWACKQDEKKNFFCPNGHSLHYPEGDTKAEKLEKRLKFEQNRREAAERECERAQRAAAIAKGKLSAQAKRVKNGVCPCCKRKFKQLARHMAAKHPGWEE